MTCSSGIGPIRIGLKFCSPTFSQRSFSLSLLTGWSPASFILRPPLPPSFPIASFGNMSSHAASSLRTASFCNSPTRPKNKAYASDHSTPHFIARKTFSSPRTMKERTVKSLRLSKALTVPETTTVYEACRRMAARKVDALLLTDSNALLCGILTDKDIATRVIAREVNLEETHVSKVMTRNPVFVLSDALAVEALQKMVQGRFRHLPVVENGEVVAILDIAKCLYDAIARMERKAEKGKAIAAAVEGIEKHWGTSTPGSNSTFMETLREQIFKPSLSTIIPQNSKVVTVSPTDSVLTTTKKMLELRASSAVVTVGDKLCGILTSKDILMRVIAQSLPPSSTLVEKVMTPNPECGTIDTPIIDALHTMHDGNFLHLLVVNRDGIVVATVDAIHITHAAVATASQVGNTPNFNNEAANSMIQKIWDSAMALAPNEEEEDSQSETSLKMISEGGETGRSISYLASSMQNAFSFKLQDRKGRLHRFTCDTRSLAEVITSVIQRVGDDIDPMDLPQILYEDEENDKVVLASDSDLAAAVDHAKTAGLKGLRLHLDYSGTHGYGTDSSSLSWKYANSEAWASAYSAIAAGAAVVAALGLLAFVRRSQ
ncbi:CBS domain-containing protein CBSCBSPB5 [Glycine soja]|uniref:CBS domain-containing protein CBSCBSPB5 n=1 Tax=Glycine soja TaxID=3848 RepID=A0A445J898_GLYSO|nr:CBS domain-containing protein CBSCBSPB1-like isoform X1 [Glycine soja]KAH1235580.1 CBS domain-containing protein CBSCBSPB5 [Glycine max]RZB94679.1 CBS domain-containing protein CBSCBSPB5 [Glycine soja]